MAEKSICLAGFKDPIGPSNPTTDAMNANVDPNTVQSMPSLRDSDCVGYRYHGLTSMALECHCFAVDEFAFANRRETPDELPIAYSSHRRAPMNRSALCLCIILENRQAIAIANQRIFADNIYGWTEFFGRSNAITS